MQGRILRIRPMQSGLHLLYETLEAFTGIESNENVMNVVFPYNRIPFRAAFHERDATGCRLSSIFSRQGFFVDDIFSSHYRSPISLGLNLLN